MCTSIWFENRFLGRTLDWMESYGEKVTVVPRNFSLKFRFEEGMENHFAIMGMAVVSDEYPLFYEGMNEVGLGMTGLFFEEETVYHKACNGKINVAPFEIIPYILGQCKSVKEARSKLESMNIVNEGFNERWGTSPLHWMIADKEECIVVESLEEGLIIYDNRYGVMTNSPTFDKQVKNYNNYMNLYSNLPGNWSSMSRFVRAVYMRNNSNLRDIDDRVQHFFRMLDYVSQIRGCNQDKDRDEEITIYSCCQDLDKGIYYYISYEHREIKYMCFDELELNEERLYVK